MNKLDYRKDHLVELLYDMGEISIATIAELNNADQTIETLKVKKLYSQFVFKTEKALAFLKFLDSFDPGEM